MVSVTGELDDAGAAIDAHFKFHGVRSTWSRRASCFHRDGSTCADDGAAFFLGLRILPQRGGDGGGFRGAGSCGAAMLFAGEELIEHLVWIRREGNQAR